MNEANPPLDPDWVRPDRSALVVIDMQVDFASPEGKIGKAGVDMSPALEACDAAVELVAAARAAKVPVVFVGLSTASETDSPVWGEWRRRMGADDDAGGICRAGTEGAAFVGPQPEAGEPVVTKQRYSGFFDSDLDRTLGALDVDTLILCGLTTECCVDCTARDAFHKDYFVFVIEDACAAYDEAMHRAALANLAINCATISSVAAIENAWKGDTRKSGEKQSEHGV